MGAATAPPAFPPSVAIGLIVLALLVALWVVLKLTGRQKPSPAVVGGLALLVAVYAATDYVVHRYKNPGQATVMEATTMDMSGMRPAAGAVPVSIEKVQEGAFAAKVTYTGTVVAFNDEDVYPRVVGRIVSLPVYPGDEVKPGQLLVKLDSEELSARERQARAGLAAASAGELAARAKVEEAAAARTQQRASTAAATAGVTEAQKAVSAAEARKREAEKALTQARHDTQAAREDEAAAVARLAGAQAAVEAAQSGIANAQAELVSAEADLAYWDAEIGRMKQLLQGGAASTDEYQMAEARQKSAAARRQQAQAAVAERKAMLASANASVKEAQASVSRAGAAAAASAAAVERMSAAVDTASAEREVAAARVEQARSQVRAAEAQLTGSAATVRASAAQQAAARALARESGAALTAASTVRGYTEIRATSRARVIERVVSPGVLVSPGTLILRLSQLHRVRLQANVTQVDMAGVQTGNPVRVHILTNPPRMLMTRVSSVFPAADPASRTSIVEAVVENPDRRLFAGQAVTMEIETGSVPRALTVPTAALVPRTGAAMGPASAVKHAVWTVEIEPGAAETVYTCPMHPEIIEHAPGTCPICHMALVPETKGGGRKLAHLVDVTTGLTDGKRTQIVTGLKAGQEIIVAGFENLREGHAVEDVPWGQGGPLALPSPVSAPPPGGSGMKMEKAAPSSGHAGHGG